MAGLDPWAFSPRACLWGVEPDWAALVREMKRPGVNLTVLWGEYGAAHPGGYSYSRFYELYREFERRLSGVITDTQAQAHWARYLCVLVSGYIETSERETVSQYTRNRASPSVLNYVDSQLAWFQNPKIDKINELLHAFDPSIAVKVGALDDATKNAVDSVVNNRHQIAHGRDVGIGAVTIKNYYTEVKKFVEFLCSELT